MKKTIAIGCDHIVTDEKIYLADRLEQAGYKVLDCGTYSHTRTHYPIYGKAVGEAVASGKADFGVALCGTGIGMSLVANKVAGIRCVVCSEPYSAQLSRMHNDTNMLALGARVVGAELAKMIARIWLETAFEGGRHQNRVDMITAIEQGGTAQDA